MQCERRSRVQQGSVTYCEPSLVLIVCQYRTGGEWCVLIARILQLKLHDIHSFFTFQLRATAITSLGSWPTKFQLKCSVLPVTQRVDVIQSRCMLINVQSSCTVDRMLGGSID